MSAGRRGVLLSVAFAVLAAGLCPGSRASAQPPMQQFQFGPNGFDGNGTGRFSSWPQSRTPDHIRQLFQKLGQGDALGPDLKRLTLDRAREQVLKEHPGIDPAWLDTFLKGLENNKDFWDGVTDQVQKHKNNPNRPPGAPPLDPRDVDNIRDRLRKNGGDPFQVPKRGPHAPGKFDPNDFDPNNFDPKRFPHADPDNPPKIDPDSRLPLDPKTNKPFDPRTGRPLDPKTGEPPAGAAPKEVPPKLGPPPLPKADAAPPGGPKAGGPDPPRVEEPKGDPNRQFDPVNPLGGKPTPEQLAKAKAYDTAAALWEKNVGPLDETPAVRKALYDLISDPEAMDALTDGKGNSIFDVLKDGEGNDFKGLFDGIDGPGWEWPKLDWKLDWGKNSGVQFPEGPRTRWPDGGGRRWPSGGGGSWGGSFGFGGMQVPWVLALLVLAAVVAFVVWWKWDAIAQLRGRGAPAPAGPGPWPLDPRGINTREDVVKAFEYLSVLICGPAARTWTHSTVADELAALALTHGGAALKLARLYELARYAPLDEPLSRAELLEARRLVCDLAGVD